ncbi:hypothetical protein QBC43DRAFT_324760 [Cladorrhinum sp. PSN259]|nr:hypothetical protein QBC43DRAFT_324760 [Cladorrhinum sp. PSN259]
MTDHHHRGRSRYDDYYEPTYTEYYESRPRRHRSLGRQALDKLGDAMAGLGIDDRDRDRDIDHHRSTHHSRHHSPHHHHHHHRSSSRHHSRHHSPHRHHHSTHAHNTHRRRAHSSSPTRHRRSHSRHYTTEREPPRASRTQARSRSRAQSRARSRSRADKGFKAAVEAGAIEAFRVRGEPGAWAGAKGKRVATAAISAGVIGTVAEKRKQDHDGDTKLGTKGSALAGMMVSRLVNGPKRDMRD